MRRVPSHIEPGPAGTRPYSFPQLVQTLLDKHCVRCHDGSTGPLKSTIVLTSEPAGSFTRSYESLKPFVKWYEWGGASIEAIVTRPGRIGADVSPLTRIISDPLHSEHVSLSQSELDRLYIWLDGNVPFYGVYDQDDQRAQQSGKLAKQD